MGNTAGHSYQLVQVSEATNFVHPRIRSWKEDDGRKWGQVTADGVA